MKSRFFAPALMAALLLTAGLAPAVAQTSLDDIEAAVAGASDDMARVDALLADADPDKRISAMKMLLESGNPAFAQRAKEAGLFSSDLAMRRLALSTIFETGGPFRIDFNLSGMNEDSTYVRAWLRDVGGSFYNDDSMGQWTFFVDQFDDDAKCWQLVGSNGCMFLPSAELYLIDWRGMRGSFQLSTDGRLLGEGAIGTGKTVKFQINLLE